MSDEPNASANEGTANAEAGIGRTIREARAAANIDVNKICTDLRIAPQALEALEQGNYHLLSGDPYIRALLGSLGRYLNLDPIALVQGYNKEIGAVHAAPSIAPYKDRTQTHTAAHKQIFIAIFALLFIVLFFLFRKLGVEESFGGKPAVPVAVAAQDTLASTAQDTTLESRSLAPDTSQTKASPDSGETRGLGPKVIPKPIAPPAGKPAGPAAVPGASTPVEATPGAPQTADATSAQAEAGTASPAPIDSSHLILAVIKPLIDSVGVKVLRFGKEDFATMLRLGKQMQVSHTDTITVMISKRKAVEVTVGGKSVIPDKKRFKIYGNTLKTF
ncbi:MAG: helix-turn-helix domain-containing protein [Fibrobacteria bacterium]